MSPLAISNPGYANGYLFYLDDKKSLRATLLDASKGAVASDPRRRRSGRFPAVHLLGRVLRGRERDRSLQPEYRCRRFSLHLVRPIRKELGTVGDIGVLSNPTLSPDDSRLAMDIADAKATSVNVWLNDVKNGTHSRFTFDSSEDVGGVWSRDGSLHRLSLLTSRTIQTSS